MAQGDNKNRTLAKLMRQVDASGLDLRLLIDDDEVLSAQRDPKFYAPLGLKFAGAILWISSIIGIYAMVGGRHSGPEPWVASHYAIAIPIWLLLAICTYWVTAKINDYGRARAKELVRLNPLIPVENGTTFPGDLADGYGTSLAFHPTGDAESPLTFVTFGSITGWWDPDSKPEKTGRGILVDQEFVHVRIDSLSGELTYLTPKRPPSREELRYISDEAFEALESMSGKYAVCIGQGGILVTLAGGTLNSFQESLMDGIATPKGWNLAYNLISGPLANIVEGLDV